jgi:hypothetical protein
LLLMSQSCFTLFMRNNSDGISVSPMYVS